MKLNYLTFSPNIHKSVYLSHNSTIIGNCTIKKEASIWFNVVLRGDLNYIEIGERSNVQENVVVHVTPAHPTIIGNDVTIGHQATLHGCSIGNSCLIGMGAIILDGAIIEEEALVAAGCVVPPNKIVPARHLAVGNPMKIIRALTPEEITHQKQNAQLYVNLAKEYELNK